MISEIAFIRDHTSFWRTISPLSEDFVRHINVQVLDRHETELISKIGTSRRAIINEVGFELFCRCRKTDSTLDDLVSGEIEDIASKASAYISHLRTKAPNFWSNLNGDEIEESKEIGRRLLNFFKRFKTVVVKPEFTGCGQLDACFGDVIADDILYEIKSGGRPFRSIDLRQLVLYSTLGRLSKIYEIKSLGLYNPRRGFHFMTSQNEFSVQFSGLSAEELCHRVQYELTSCDLMRFEEVV
ncbi:MAG: hypothetical protein WBK77_04150 [Alphaproteobacteria bacterium]